MPDSNKQVQELWQKFGKIKDNPYIFSLQKSEIVKPVADDAPLPHEEEITREQRLTFFENDEAMRRMFGGDFELYSQALDEPELMIKRLEERMAQVEQSLARQAQSGAIMPDWWEDEFWGDDWEEPELVGELDGVVESDWADDLLYQKAHKWAHRLNEIANQLYDSDKNKDPDLYRVLINVFLVPAKIVYASDDEDSEAGDEIYDKIEAEISLHGYTLCLTFLQRVRESLARLIAKKLAPIDEWRAALRAADELSLDIQGQMLELAKRLHNS